MSVSHYISRWLVLALVLTSSTMNAAESKERGAVEIVEVWTKKGWPPEDYPTPNGFRISPFQAFRAVAQSKRLSLKHNWFCFRDSQFYYIADSFEKSISAKNAVKHGIRIDGDTGQLK